MRRLLPVLVALAVVSAVCFAETVTLWYAWGGAEAEALHKILSEFEAKTGIKVNAQFVPFDALRNKLQTAVPAGQGPDVFIGPHDWVGPLAQAGILCPMEGYVSEEELKNYSVAGALLYKGHLYGLPVAVKCPALIYNKNLVPEAPKTLSELVEIARRVTDPKKGIYGLVWDVANYYFTVAFINGFGGYTFGKTEGGLNPFDIGIDKPGAIKALQFIQDLIHKYEVVPSETNYNVMMTLFCEGKAGMIINGPWCVGDVLKAAKNRGFEVGFALLPEVDVYGVHGRMRPFVTVEGVMLTSIARKGGFSRFRAAVKLIKFITGPRGGAIAAAVAKLVPANALAMKEKEFVEMSESEKEIISVFATQAKFGEPMPNIPEMSAVWGPGADAIAKVVQGESPERALRRAARKIRKAIKEMHE